jgi:hydroxymethylpyrimidine/phosphomethylpyrimidine kinase
MKHLLTIAGSDSSGGAGIQADLKTFAAHGSYGMSVITAVTAQNTTGVTAIQNIDPGVVEAQIDAVFSDIRVDAVKVGMVSTAPLIRVIAKKLAHWKPQILIVDPVMVATSGAYLLEADARGVLMSELLPLATVITPNLMEGQVLSGKTIRSREEMEDAAADILARGIKGVLLKGGHLAQTADDLLMTPELVQWFEGRRIDNPNTHGTGCSLSSSLAANLAKGMELTEAVRAAKAYVALGIANGLPVGHGHGPIHHFVELYRKGGVNV